MRRRFDPERLGTFAALTGLLYAVSIPAGFGATSKALLSAELTVLGSLLVLLGALRRGAGIAWGSLAWLGLAGLLLLRFTGFVTFESEARTTLLAVSFVAGATLGRNAPTRRLLLANFLTMAIVLALFGIAQSLYLQDSARASARLAAPGLFEAADFAAFASSNRARSVFGQANGFAGFLLLVLPFAASAAIPRGPVVGRALVFAVVLVGAFVVAGSIGAAIALLGVVAAGCAFEARRSALARTAAWCFGGLFVAGVAMVTALIAGWRPGQVAGVDPRSFLHRLDYWSQALALWRTAPVFGVGLGNYPDFVEPGAAGRESSLYAHQGYLAMLAEGGIVGLALLLGCLALAIRWVMRAPTAARSDVAVGPRRLLDLAPVILAIGLDFGRVGFLILDTWTFAGLAANTALTVAVAWAAWRYVADPIAACLDAEPTRLHRSVALALLGIFLHALVDFDLEIPGVIAALALVAALRPFTSTATSRGVPTLAPLIVTILVLLGVGRWALLPQAGGMRDAARFFPPLHAPPKDLDAGRRLEDLEKDVVTEPIDVALIAMWSRALLESDFVRPSRRLRDFFRDRPQLKAAPLLRRRAAIIEELFSEVSGDEPPTTEKIARARAALRDGR